MNLEAIKRDQVKVIQIRENTKKRKVAYQNPDDYIFDNDNDREESFRILDENNKNGNFTWRQDDEQNKYGVGRYCVCKYCKHFEPIEN